MKTAVTFHIDTDNLRGVPDVRLHALWHICQANPAPMHDRAACELVGDIGAEIVRRWLSTAPAEQYAHQPGLHDWHTLQQHGNWRGPGGTWLPHDAESRPPGADACTAPAEIHNTPTARG